MHRAMQGLNLTDEQKTAMKKIHESTKAQLDAVNKDESLTADQKAAKIHELRHSGRMQMVKLLDAGTTAADAGECPRDERHSP